MQAYLFRANITPSEFDTATESEAFRGPLGYPHTVGSVVVGQERSPEHGTVTEPGFQPKNPCLIHLPDRFFCIRLFQ